MAHVERQNLLGRNVVMATTMDFVSKLKDGDIGRNIQTLTLNVDVEQAAAIARLVLNSDHDLYRVNINESEFIVYPMDARPQAIHMNNPVALRLMDIDDDEYAVLKIGNNDLAEVFDLVDYEDDDGEFVRGIAIGSDFVPLSEFVKYDTPWMKGGE